jgi:hypothetical protein
VRLAAAVLAALALATAGQSTPRPVPRLDHVVVIVFENENRPSVLGSGRAPMFDRLARGGADLMQYFAVGAPSLPNYLALVSGSTHGITDDCTRCAVRGTTIGDLLTRAHRSWGAYAEGYPRSPRFAKKHEPFLYFARDQTHVRPLTALRTETLPTYALVAPDLCHSMHDCSVGVGDRWLARFVPPLLRVPRTAVFVVFDEGGGTGTSPLAAVVAGTAVAPGTRYTRRATHYSVLRTIEDALGIPRLGRSATAQPITGIWR